MKNLLKVSLFILVTLLLANCNNSSRSKSSLTGWNFNDPNYGNYIKGGAFENLETPSGMVAIEGGSFIMGQVQDDVMFDWNTTPNKMHVRSFYMDETEVTNSEYFLYLQNIKDIFPPKEEQYKHIYEAALPDTLVWRKSLGNTDLLSENYLRHPAYSEYPVVGVSWIQANQYCKWRTNAVNLKMLIDRGYITNILKNDTVSNFFDTDLFYADANKLFKGDSTIYKKGIPVKGQKKQPKGSFRGRQIIPADAILVQKFRLPTEAEWEYAAKANIENRQYNNIRGRKKYAWDGKYTRNKSKRYKGDQLANFKQGKGEYSGLAGWGSDGSDIPISVKSYKPNAFGLYDMSGNVAEWVADIYRPIIDADANDFNYFRGNVFTKRMIGEDGKVVTVGSDKAQITYDTLLNGKIVLKQLPGTIKYVPVTETDTYMRRNYSIADNSNYKDGDKNSSRFYAENNDESTKVKKMYNSPEQPNEKTKRTTLISDKTRVFKGGSWADREYWLDPAQRRYLPEYIATNYIGFRCVTDKVGPMNKKRRATTRK